MLRIFFLLCLLAPARAEEPAVVDDLALVHIYRSNAFYGYFQSFDVLLNGKKVADLTNATDLQIKLKPGAYRLKVAPGGLAIPSEISINVSQGETLHYQYNLPPLLLSNWLLVGASIDVIAKEQALRDESELKVARVTLSIDGSVDTAPRIGKHNYIGPRETGWAAIDDVSIVPIREEGQERYRYYLSLKSPKVFVAHQQGGWRMWWGDPNSISKAIQFCSQQKNPCWLYAVDDRVVWHSDVSKRIGQPEQIMPVPD